MAPAAGAAFARLLWVVGDDVGDELSAGKCIGGSVNGMEKLFIVHKKLLMIFCNSMM